MHFKRYLKMNQVPDKKSIATGKENKFQNVKR